MDLSVICNWEEGEKVSLEFISLFGRPWQYRGEGNANIVIALQDDLRVVRLSKVKVGEWIGDSSRHLRKVEREVTFANNIFVPLLGVEYVGLVQAVHIGADQIHRLNESLRPLRPSYRLHKELKVPYATAHPDFARIHPYPSHRHDYCIEIKPKQGWWPKHLKQGVPNSDPKLCTYCLNQFLKLKRSKITCRTGYCPLDLFSGVPDRIIRALIALTSNPQNNLRIFKDGRLVYGENMSDSLSFLLEEWMQAEGDCDSINDSDSCGKGTTEPLSAISNFIFLLCMALLKPKRTPEGIRFPDRNGRYEKLKCEIQEILSRSHLEYLFNSTEVTDNRDLTTSCSDSGGQLPDGSILSRILEIQKLADIRGGTERIYSLYKKICPKHTMDGKEAGCFPLPDMSPVLRCPKNNDGGQLCCCESCSGDESGSEVESIEGDLTKSDWEEEEDVTLREEINLEVKEKMKECPSVLCLSEEKWLDEIAQLSLLSKDEIQEMEHYLLASTAKDCSIMITFSPVHGVPTPDLSLIEAEADSISSLYSPTSPSIINYKDSDLILQDMNGTFHRVRIGVADLDPKPVSSIVKHYLRDRDMMEDFSEYLNLHSH